MSVRMLTVRTNFHFDILCVLKGLRKRRFLVRATLVIHFVIFTSILTIGMAKERRRRRLGNFSTSSQFYAYSSSSRFFRSISLLKTSYSKTSDIRYTLVFETCSTVWVSIRVLSTLIRWKMPNYSWTQSAHTYSRFSYYRRNLHFRTHQIVELTKKSTFRQYAILSHHYLKLQSLQWVSRKKLSKSARFKYTSFEGDFGRSNQFLLVHSL